MSDMAMFMEWRVTGRAGDGGTLTRVGDDLEALGRELRESGREVVLVEGRKVSEWGLGGAAEHASAAGTEGP
jgi:hypothetical protein